MTDLIKGILLLLLSISLFWVSGVFGEAPRVNDNDRFMVWENHIVNKDRLEYARIVAGEGDGKFAIDIEPIGRLNFDTKAERDESWSILLRKLKLRDNVEPE